MTIRRIWLISLMLIALVSVGITAATLTVLTDNTFVGYLSDNYQNHIEQLISYSAEKLSTTSVNYDQMSVELESHLDDPIMEIKLYDPEGVLLVAVDDKGREKSGMMGGMMLRSNKSKVEVDQYDVKVDGQLLGILNIKRQSTTENSIVARLFKANLMRNSVYSVGVALIIAMVFGFFVSKSMSRGLRETAVMAGEIEMGNALIAKEHYIQEINQIRISLNELNQRLMIKNRSRKVLVDQMLHQTRTPLTVLKMHIEALEDGIIQLDDEERRICAHQVEELTHIITNMGEMMDADRDDKKLAEEEVEIPALIKLIVRGLKPQFDLKHISIDMKITGHIKINTDRYRLSQVIYNLLTNAYKYTNEHGQVLISSYSESSRTYIEVADNGVGISESDLDKIFNAYFRSAQTSNIQGEGIGLFIVKENLNIMGGGVEVSSVVGKGTTFKIWIES